MTVINFGDFIFSQILVGTPFILEKEVWGAARKSIFIWYSSTPKLIGKKKKFQYSVAFDSILYSVHAWSTKTINSSHSLGNSELQASLTGGQISPSPETQPLLVTSSIPLNRKHTPLPTHFTHYKLAVLLWCQHQFYLERPLIKQQVRLLDHKFGKTVALAS